MTKDELLAKFDKQGKIKNEYIYVFATDDLDACICNWVYGQLHSIYTYRDYSSFGIVNKDHYMHYKKYIIMFEDFNPYDMEESVKHVITLN